jgi:hypothetical protein
MPRRRITALGAACLTCIALAVAAGSAGAASTTANLRVLNTAGTTLADQSQVTGDVTIKTDPNAKCFGDPGGSGNSVNVPGPTALGIVQDALSSDPALRPLSVTDQFGFGLGVCGIGGFTFTPSDIHTWYLKVNHVGASASGDHVAIGSGDEVLWYLAPNYNSLPNELQLVAPASAPSGQPVTVRVFAFDNSGQRTPVAGALVTGATQPTAADGSTSIVLTQTLKLQALHGTDIPSNQQTVACAPTSQSPCGFASKVARHRIVGTNKRDRIRGSSTPDLIRSRAGNDHINTRGGFDDVVNCGRGKDKAIVDDTDLTRRCEKVIHKK